MFLFRPFYARAPANIVDRLHAITLDDVVHFLDICSDNIFIRTKPKQMSEQFVLDGGPDHKRIIQRSTYIRGGRRVENYSNFSGMTRILYHRMMRHVVTTIIVTRYCRHVSQA